LKKPIWTVHADSPSGFEREGLCHATVYDRNARRAEELKVPMFTVADDANVCEIGALVMGDNAK